ncbi:MAG: GtrA family protein [Pseudomonadota bacterium]
MTALLRYSAVGAFGFVVDASVLSVLVLVLDQGLYLSRFVSFTLAATATWLVNRAVVFQPANRTAQEYMGYLLVQIAGAGVNLGIYVILLHYSPALGAWPVVPLAVGAGVALLFNFFLLKRFVFGAVRTRR